MHIKEGETKQERQGGWLDGDRKRKKRLRVGKMNKNSERKVKKGKMRKTGKIKN